jgi:uncharacterized protein YqhQ
MKGLLKKYAILVIASIIIARLLTVSIMTIWPDLLTTKLPNGGIHTLSTNFLETGIDFLINIGFIFLLAKEMKNEKIYSVPVLILTFFSSMIGVLFFFLILAENKLKYKQLDS